ncbi:hypothetical protein K438DRAFT_1765522 [Mycena galopus ATCC 62051]|nr:hypothetical protein K438DRAFT_1765522 [Mycena galopus ATCC 62051]
MNGTTIQVEYYQECCSICVTLRLDGRTEENRLSIARGGWEIAIHIAKFTTNHWGGDNTQRKSEHEESGRARQREEEQRARRKAVSTKEGRAHSGSRVGKVKSSASGSLKNSGVEEGKKEARDSRGVHVRQEVVAELKKNRDVSKAAVRKVPFNSKRKVLLNSKNIFQPEECTRSLSTRRILFNSKNTPQREASNTLQFEEYSSTLEYSPIRRIPFNSPTPTPTRTNDDAKNTHQRIRLAARDRANVSKRIDADGEVVRAVWGGKDLHVRHVEGLDCEVLRTSTKNMERGQGKEGEG